MSQWLQHWNPFREPGGTIADDLDLLQAMDQSSQETFFEAPSFGEDTSFSDATLCSAAAFGFEYGGAEESGTVVNNWFGRIPSGTSGHILRQGVDDSFMTLPALNETDNDWFNSIFDEQGLVYNDKNLGEAATQPCIKSEHSYSANNISPSSPLSLGKIDDTAIFSHNGNALDLTQKNQLIHAAATASQPQFVKAESSDPDPLLVAMTCSDTATTLTRPATIILATTTSSTSQAHSHSAQTMFPAATVQIKTEPMDYEGLQEQIVNVDAVLHMPPTPPSSAGSDSDGSQSPQRSAPNSPQRQSPVRVYQYHHLQHQHHYHHHANSPLTSTCAAQTLAQQPLFLGPMPQSGVLLLSEEEKRTLISEGYPIPAKLPLTKQEEKNLKKVRRKIKNKISAQESRRKKKEYLEALEKRVEAFNHENSDLKKKVDSLENNNRTLMGQLAKLQAAIAKVPRSASATQTGTVLMVLVLCFAVFLGGSGGGPSSLNVGYRAVQPASLAFQQPGPLRAQPNMGPGPTRADDTAEDYTTPNWKSRVLMAVSKEEQDDWCDDYRPLVPRDTDQSCPTDMEPGLEPQAENAGPADPGVSDVLPVVSKVAVEEATQQSMAVVTVAVGSEKNATESIDDYQAMMHPDIAVAPTLGNLGNFTADLETA
ncbi:cyclic AMP-responsive element-binding protein 3-like protein 1 isoform X2 [Littorina saxatilis]|uniref:cyclic AMP-responsive element-binding protein 3-like protein 1 isoform X2 n=1 Tax=Littorina saxatilis TaxID=31220 RepID=UPI0038B69720